MSMAAFFFASSWGILSLFFFLLVRIGAKPVPAPPARASIGRCTVRFAGFLLPHLSRIEQTVELEEHTVRLAGFLRM